MDFLTERHDLEALWRERVLAARKRYERACSERRKADTGTGPPGQDSDRTETEALAEYADALGAFADLVLRGKRP